METNHCVAELIVLGMVKTQEISKVRFAIHQLTSGQYNSAWNIDQAIAGEALFKKGEIEDYSSVI
jgi:hypothetical protein